MGALPSSHRLPTSLESRRRANYYVITKVCERGVHSDSSICERFLRVEKMAKRTAMVDNDGGDGNKKNTLFRYALSYLQV